ncbi:transporter substrate-binding domain-containing protein [Aeromonas australiensis]|uniref:transporter substrate-binding domain-containing protein n=1 Tax=Aeromonas australiensis TaxID=1114880 RepID=UPI00058A5149|nr:transporter substrate-binding domain-containing protein [Aeromonas australiensis]
MECVKAKALVNIFFSATMLLNTANAKERLVWIQQDFSPFYIKEDGYTNGIADKIIDLIQAELPEYEHEKKFLPIKRVILAMESGANVICITFLKDDEVSKIANYSVATMILPPHVIVTRKEVSSKLKSKMSLIEMKNGRLVMSIPDGRHFSEEISRQIRAFPRDDLHIRNGDHFRGIARMIVSGRVDYTIAYPFELKYIQSANSNMHTLSKIKIDGNDKFIPAYAITPKSVFGNDLIDKVNRALYRIRDTPEYKSAHVSWIDSDDNFESAYEDFSNGKYD